MIKKEINELIKEYYWIHDYNCATTSMKIFSITYSISLEKQLINSLIGMHGAGKYGAQCGLVEGALMFIGIIGKKCNLSNDQIVDLCYGFAKGYEKKFGSLKCSELRPEGFNKKNPEHLCENLTNKSVKYTMNFINEQILKVYE